MRYVWLWIYTRYCRCTSSHCSWSSHARYGRDKKHAIVFIETDFFHWDILKKEKTLSLSSLFSLRQANGTMQEQQLRLIALGVLRHRLRSPENNLTEQAHLRGEFKSEALQSHEIDLLHQEKVAMIQRFYRVILSRRRFRELILVRERILSRARDYSNASTGSVP